ncbi:unnamed protein product [Cylicostephanus goldi]|uniref:Uncharacterized protein n=1 Tax=Cylicostephanus goldi TaxID=71465 RepID=A0A3P6TGE6_CYLGO|nr:unnamed protein product [Cylicostephanus goldi]
MDMEGKVPTSPPNAAAGSNTGGKEQIQHPKNTQAGERKEYKQYNEDGIVNKFHESRGEAEAKADPNRDYATQTIIKDVKVVKGTQQ